MYAGTTIDTVGIFCIVTIILDVMLVKTGRFIKRLWQKNIWNKMWMVLILILIGFFGTAFGIAQWYKFSERDKPLVMGVSYIPAYAESLGMDAEETLDALIEDVGIRHFRLVSYWSQLETEQGAYNFDLLDWQFDKIEQAGGTVTLSLGLRQPRWPECHMPDWAEQMPAKERQGHLNDFIAAVVRRYQNSPALVSYQLENEFLLTSFAPHCPEIRPEQVIEELELVKSIDPDHPVIISRSDNFPFIPMRQPVPDEYGISVYRRVWDATFTQRYFQYPFPPWYYAFLAGAQKLVHGKSSIIHELQAEAWPPHGQSILETSLEEQNKTINADRLQKTINFGQKTGIREIYLWGAEYWLYRKQALNDPSLWEVARTNFRALE